MRLGTKYPRRHLRTAGRSPSPPAVSPRATGFPRRSTTARRAWRALRLHPAATRTSRTAPGVRRRCHRMRNRTRRSPTTTPRTKLHPTSTKAHARASTTTAWVPGGAIPFPPSGSPRTPAAFERIVSSRKRPSPCFARRRPSSRRAGCPRAARFSSPTPWRCWAAGAS